MKSILIIGIGRFGKHLAQKFAELGNEVMVVDKLEAPVEEISPIVTSAQIADCMDENVLRSLGVGNFDLCFVCIGSNFQSSLEITSLLKELGARHVVSKADRDIHAKFLLRNGADEVIYPEKDVAQRAALKYSANHMFDYIELSPEYTISEIVAPAAWMGRTISEVDVRSKYNVNVLAVKENERIVALTDAQHVFSPTEHLIIAASRKDTEKLLCKRQGFVV
jgi:trk system potassium uptake protein TrkA